MNRFSTFGVLVSAVVLASGCATISTDSAAPTATMNALTDDEQILRLYENFRAELAKADAETFVQIFCPGVRGELEPPQWFKHAGQVRAVREIENFTPPDGGVDAPNATEWRRILFDPSGRLRVAKIDGTWYACET